MDKRTVDDARLNRNFLFGCGCGCLFNVKNVAWQVQMQSDVVPCTDCQMLIDNPIAESPFFDDSPSVAGELGWCGCGQPRNINEVMLTYLSGLRERGRVLASECRGLLVIELLGTVSNAPRFPFGMDEDLALTYAYIADDLGWTDHGGNIQDAWLTDDGEIALTNLETLRKENK